MCHRWGLAWHYAGLWGREALWWEVLQQKQNNWKIAKPRTKLRKQCHLPLLCELYLLLQLHHDKLVCGSHNGQLWLSYARFLHPWLTPSRRIYNLMGRIWSKRSVSWKFKLSSPSPSLNKTPMAKSFYHCHCTIIFELQKPQPHQDQPVQGKQGLPWIPALDTFLYPGRPALET